MTKKKTFTLVAIMAVAALTFALSAQAGGKGKGKAHGDCDGSGGCGKGKFMHGGHGPKGGPLGLIPDIVDKLDLTVDQKSKVKDMREAFKKEIEPIMKKKHELKKEMIELMQKDKPNMTAVKAKFKEVKALKEKMMDLHFDHVLDLFNILTKAQKQKMWDLIDEMKPPKGFGPPQE
ncbi:MAG: Spy/CpxP family protein refolding chaperone [Pseudomonadota bacterium]